MADPLREAATRLEAAVERLATAAGRPRAALPDTEVAELGRRLDTALARLRLALAEAADEGEPGMDEPEAGEEGPDPSRPGQGR